MANYRTLVASLGYAAVGAALGAGIWKLTGEVVGPTPVGDFLAKIPEAYGVHGNLGNIMALLGTGHGLTHTLNNLAWRMDKDKLLGIERKILGLD